MTDAKPPLRAVFLDIGDTVMRPNPSWEGVYALAFREFGVDVGIDELHTALRRAYHHGGWGMEGGFDPTEETSFQRTVAIDAAAIAELGLQPMPEAFYRRLSELFMVTSHWHIFPDAYPTLTALQERGLIVGAVSNWVWNLPELLHALDLVQHFDFIAASARIGFEKPHRRIFEWALEQAKVEPAAVIHVGDHVDADIEGARAAGIDGVLIDRFERYAPDDVPAGIPVISSLDELLPIVDARMDRPMSERWRCFVAVPIGDALRADLATAMDAWREIEGLRWADPKAWHVTLAFLGAVDAAEISRLEVLVGDVAAHNEPMHLRTGDLGAFPSVGRARVLWYGIADPDGAMAALSADLHAALGMDLAAPYRPHVTLARARRPIDLRILLEHAAAPTGELTVDRLELMRSHLGRGPARYETLASSALGVPTRV